MSLVSNHPWRALTNNSEYKMYSRLWGKTARDIRTCLQTETWQIKKKYRSSTYMKVIGSRSRSQGQTYVLSCHSYALDRAWIQALYHQGAAYKHDDGKFDVSYLYRDKVKQYISKQILSMVSYTLKWVFSTGNWTRTWLPISVLTGPDVGSRRWLKPTC